MKKIFKSVLLLAAVTMGTGAFVGCSDDEKLETADALFRPIINEDDNIEQGLDENKIPYVVVTWDNYTNANQYTIKMEATDGSDTQEQITDKLTCRFENLKYDKEYFVYISSANTTTGLASKEYSITATTPDSCHVVKFVDTNEVVFREHFFWSFHFDDIILFNANFEHVTSMNPNKSSFAMIEIVGTLSQIEVQDVDRIHLFDLIIVLPKRDVLGYGLGSTIENTLKII